jgi:hypothetical protein
MLKTLSFGVYPDDATRESLLESLLQEWQTLHVPTFIWQVPGFVLSGIQHAQQQGISALSRKLLLEGLMYQLLGHGLNQRQHTLLVGRSTPDLSVYAPCLSSRRNRNIPSVNWQHSLQ